MTPIEAVSKLAELMRGDRDLTLAVTAACQARECKDIYEYAERFPDEIVLLTEQVADVYDQDPGLESAL